MNEKNKWLTIGQFAALHGINKKTLMWYDKIGLFQPAKIHPENGYRYYNYYQSSILETILLLRELDVSIDEIQVFMKQRSAANLEKLLKEKLLELDEHITHLKAIRKTLANHHQNMQTLLTIDLTKLSIVEKEEHCLVTININKEDSFDKIVETITTETQKYQLRRLHDASYGTMIPVKSLYEGNFENYSKYFIEIPFPIQKVGLHIQPGGTYLRAFYQGDWKQMFTKYQEILNYAKEQKLELFDFSYEMIINENVIDRIEDSIVQIEIPIRSFY